MQAFFDGCVDQVVVFHPLGKQLQAQGKLAPPNAVLVKLFVERHRGTVCWADQYSIAAPKRPLSGAKQSSGFLAMSAVKSGALALPDALDRGVANTARLPGTVVHHGLQLEVARLTLGIGEVPQRAAAFCNGT